MIPEFLIAIPLAAFLVWRWRRLAKRDKSDYIKMDEARLREFTGEKK